MTADYTLAVRTRRFDLLEREGQLIALIETILYPDHLWVENLAVSPKHQGQGLGQRMMAHAECIGRMLGHTEIKLVTSPAFTGNVDFYRRRGFAIEREEPFRGGVAVYLHKPLLASELPADLMSARGENSSTSSKKDFVLRIARWISAGDFRHVAEWFTDDFKLHDPSIGGFRSGHDGARDMLRSLAEHVPGARIDVLDMVEEDNRVAVRWLFSGTKDGMPVYLSVVTIYRFDGDRIAEDWGIAAKAAWPMTATSATNQLPIRAPHTQRNRDPSGGA